MQRVLAGTLHRFDSVSAMIDACRRWYRTTDVCAVEVGGEFLLRVGRARDPFESLIVHFEGERTYAVMLPHLDEPPPSQY